MTIKGTFIDQLHTSFPGLRNAPLENLVADQLISPFNIELPKKVLQQAQAVVHSLFQLRQKKSYLDHYHAELTELGLKDPGNKSILMSYDFHINDDGDLKLIEINTNASFLALGTEMYKMKQLPMPVTDFSMNEIRENILAEMRLQGKSTASNFSVAITDDKPSEQRLYAEFLVYQELFKSWGWDSHIVDFRELFAGRKFDFIYNRYTDFFLTAPESQTLRQKFLAHEVCLSPNPFEYFLLASKQRLTDWTVPGFLESMGISGEELALLRTVIPATHSVSAANADQIWAERKKLFMKPKNAFGSKQSYKGSSISRKAFEELIHQDTVAQEYVPAPERVFETPTGPQSFKFDLRCYAYQDRMHFIVARIYQGQVTNLRTPLGGFTAVTFI
jgi:hypothetical protein